jgi:tetratricopeptide (TPR) repeat protein
MSMPPPSDSDEAGRLLATAVQAARRGEREAAREQLMALLELDENNLQAWLWLSGLVDDDADKRICLENALSLQPDNAAAQRGLALLDAAAPKRKVVKEYAPISPATAVLYPERLTQSWEWTEPELPPTAVTHPAIQAQSVFDDVWSGDFDLCAYCAAPLQSLADERRCPACGRSLLATHFRYPQPSAHIHILWVLLLALGQLFLIQLFIDLILDSGTGALLVDLLVMAVAFCLAGGVYFRQYWAYAAAILFFFLITLGIMVNLLSGGALVNLLAGGQTVTIGEMDLLTDTFRAVLGQSLLLFQPFQALTAVLGLVVAIFFAAPDFERVQFRLAAGVDRGLRDPSSLYSVGKSYAERGMLATAVRHFQRAAANDPLKASYAKSLGEAYAKLGFRERALDALQTAHRLATYPPLQAEIAALIAQVDQSES